jgi:hypothetical protein
MRVLQDAGGNQRTSILPGTVCVPTKASLTIPSRVLLPDQIVWQRSWLGTWGNYRRDPTGPGDSRVGVDVEVVLMADNEAEANNSADDI